MIKKISLLVLSPIIVFFIIELFLNIINYGHSSKLIVPFYKKDNIQHYHLNYDIGKSIFFKEFADASIKESRAVSISDFTKEKDSSTLRVFVLGASTVKGFPFSPRFSFSAFLEKMLSKNSNKNIEVINCGITGISLNHIRLFFEEIKDFNADAVVLYAGHNEYYGVHGSGSYMSLFKSPRLINLYIKFQSLKTYKLLDKLIITINKNIKPPSQKKFIFQEMIDDSEILYGSKKYQQALDNYTYNLKAISKSAKESGINLIISTLITNLSDCSPMGPTHSINLRENIKLKADLLYNKAETNFKNSNYLKAESLLISAINIDSLYAPNYFLLGKIELERKRFDAAYSFFSKARDLDATRFRAPSEINKIIKRISKEDSLQLANIDSLIITYSDDKQIGSNFITEHIHPTIYANYLIGAYLSSIILKSPNYFFNSCEFKDLKTELGYNKIDELKLNANIKIFYQLPGFAKQFNLENKIKQLDSLDISIIKQMDTTSKKVYQQWLKMPNIPYHFLLAELYFKQTKFIKALNNYSVFNYKNDPFLPLSIEASLNTIVLKLMLSGGVYNASKEFKDVTYRISKLDSKEHSPKQIEKITSKIKDIENIFIQNQKIELALLNSKKSSIKGNHRIALNILIDANKIDPSNGLIVNRMACEYGEMNISDSAIIFFETAIKLAPSLKEAYSNLGIAYANKKEYQKAVNIFTRYLLIHPKDKKISGYLKTIQTEFLQK